MTTETAFHQGDEYPLPPARELYECAARYRLDTEEPLTELGQLIEALHLVALGIMEVSGKDDAAPIFGMVAAMRATYGRLMASMKATDAKVDALFKRAKKGAGQ